MCTIYIYTKKRADLTGRPEEEGMIVDIVDDDKHLNAVQASNGRFKALKCEGTPKERFLHLKEPGDTKKRRFALKKTHAFWRADKDVIDIQESDLDSAVKTIDQPIETSDG